MVAFEQAHPGDARHTQSDSHLVSQATDTSALATSSGTGRELIRQVAFAATDVDKMLGGPNSRFELTQAKEQLTPGDADLIQRGVRSLLSDATKGDGFSPDSVAAFQRIYQEAASRPGATPQSIMAQLNEVGAAINQRVGNDLGKDPSRIAEPIGMGAKQNDDGSISFYMMLSKDRAALAKNRGDIISGNHSPSIIELGPYKPGQPI
ncbi:MAG: hypothetical protein P4L53_11070 [Candidatus Obscuribacterales bacterium]|nr:hypothetical protein [Candidatus Obscuribacterales bacterium]